VLRNTLRRSTSRTSGSTSCGVEESARRTLRYSLYQALEQVERLLESDMMEVPIEMQAACRQIVEAVDSSSPTGWTSRAPARSTSGHYFRAQDRLIKQVRNLTT